MLQSRLGPWKFSLKCPILRRMQGNEGIEALVLAEELIAPRCLHVPLVSHAVTPCNILVHQFQNEVGLCVIKCIGNSRTWLHKLGIEGGSLLGLVTSMKHQEVMART